MKKITILSMLEAGVHYGHLARYWNPLMAQYIFGSKSNIHIINLEKTAEHIKSIQQLVKEAGSKNSSILFVGTKKAAREVIKEKASEINQPYVCKRWLGGTLTNYKTIRKTIEKLEDLEAQRDSGKFEDMIKKEALKKEKSIARLTASVGGIAGMKRLPDYIFITDLNYEKNAVAEAKELGLPIIAIADTNIDPNKADFIIPGNDDSVKAIALYMDAIVDAYKEGQEEFNKSMIVKKEGKEVEAEKESKPSK